MTSRLDAVLVISEHCPHCEGMLRLLSERVKRGQIDSLQIVNIQSLEQYFPTLSIRSVPWLKLADAELPGAHDAEEIDQWITYAREGRSLSEFYARLFQSGQMTEVLRRVRAEPGKLEVMMQLLFRKPSRFVERIGIGAVIEDLEAQPELAGIIPLLNKLAVSDDAKDRTDAAYYLGLTHSDKALPILMQLAEDDSLEVAEEAADAIELIQES